jgi:hypothetical protein
MVVVAAVGQEQQPPIQDLNLLIGKEVTVQRVPLCQPGTYTHVLAYAGKQAKVVSLKPLHLAALPRSALDRLSAETRATIEDYRKSATILVQFEDQTQLDTCTAVPPSRLEAISLIENRRGVVSEMGMLRQTINDTRCRNAFNTDSSCSKQSTCSD